MIGRVAARTGLDRAARRGTDAAGRALGLLGGGEIVYLVGLAGNPNYGDELVLRTWLRYLARVRPGATVVVDCAHVGQAGLLFAGDHPRAVFVDTLWQLARLAGDPARLGDAAPQDWVAAAATDLGARPDLAEGVDHLLRASSVHLVGGGYVNGMWPHWLPVVSAVAAVARTTGARAFATGLGLAPLPTGAGLDRLLADAARFEVFDVRDTGSFREIVGAPGASFTGDDVWLGLPAPSAQALPPGGVVLCAQQDLTGDFEWGGRSGVDGLAGFLEVILDAWRVPGDRVTVVEGIPAADYTVPLRMGKRLAGARVIPFLDLWRGGLPTGCGQTWISTRFHPHLVAAAAGDSGVAISTRPDYYAAKHRSLQDSGSRWTVVEGGDAIPERPRRGGFSPAARDDLVARKTELAARLYPRRR